MSLSQPLAKKMFLKREKTNSEFYFHNFIFVRVKNQQTNELYFSRSHDDIQAFAGIELNTFSNNIMSPDFHNTFQLEKTGPKWSLFWVPEIDFFWKEDWWRGRERRGVCTKNVNCKIAVNIWKICIWWWKRVDTEVLTWKIRMSRTTLVINVFAYICLSGCY